MATTLVGVAWVLYELFIAFVDHHFAVGVVFYLPPLLLVGIALGRRFLHRETGASALGPSAVGLMLLSSGLQQAGIGLHPIYFNHNALYHLLQAIALVLLFSALRERSSRVKPRRRLAPDFFRGPCHQFALDSFPSCAKMKM